MAHLGFTLNPDDYPDEYEPLPAGEYLSQVIHSEIKDTKRQDGQMLVLTFEVMSGAHSGRRFFERLNIVNSNSQAQNIAIKSLARLSKEVGAGAITDSEELHHKPVIVKIVLEESNDPKYGPQNRVKGYGNAHAAQATKRQPNPSQPITPKGEGPPVGGKLPWERTA